MKVAFIGKRGLGAVRMRGEDVAKRLGVPFLDLRELGRKRFDTLVLVKYHFDRGADLRNACDRLVYDPLDCWERWRYKGTPEAWFWKCYKEVRPDDVLATSPANAEIWGHVLTSQAARVHLAPHHADPRVGPNWYDPAGPIVYCGGERFIAKHADAIAKGAGEIGKSCVIRTGNDAWKALHGASLMLHPRWHPHDTPLNRWCKPQIKLENAAAAGLPVLATDDPAVTTLRPEVTLFDYGLSFAENLRRGLASAPLRNPVTLDQHVAFMRGLIYEEAARAA